MTLAFSAGFALGLSLILAIGAQNAFVLRQGIRREHVFAVCLTCALSDTLLIAVGVTGFGWIVSTAPWIAPLMTWGGAAFLAVYGAMSFWRAATQVEALAAATTKAGSLRATLVSLLALTFLNPHVYLDTVVLLGSVSTQYGGARLAFGTGAATSSFVFFFALGYGARLLAPLFARPMAWRVLDVIIGVVMWSIALKLVLT
ncbi:MAG: LysE/ArgO family amino acid transporter [Pseudomonadota bacterium]